MSRLNVNVHGLTPRERLELIEELWESLADSEKHLPLTDAQRQELDRRLDEVDRGEAPGIPWDEVLSRIRAEPE